MDFFKGIKLNFDKLKDCRFQILNFFIKGHVFFFKIKRVKCVLTRYQNGILTHVQKFTM